MMTAFVATSTASVSYAAYYCITSLALFSSMVPGASGENVDEQKNGLLFKEEKRKADAYDYEYVGFDTYPGIHLDDGTGVATKEVKAASLKVISQAMDAAGLDDNGIIKSANGEHITIHPMHAHRTTCPIYGCPFLPLDVHYEEEAKKALDDMKKEASAENVNNSKFSDKDSVLKTSGSENAATLTLIGYKGGRLVDQVNQDRALVLSPYNYWNILKSSGSDQSAKPVARLLGAFDGHAKWGERVSEYVAKTLPALLGSKLVEFDATKDKEAPEQQNDHKIAQLLRDTFLELDATAPADPSGGCTASIVLQLDNKIYVANAGDSRSFVAVHVVPPDGKEATTSIIHGTREDKPHLTIERERVEHMGGTVYLPNGFLATGQGTTRVLYRDPTTGSTSGLAMSRSIGDWDAGNVGVIPDPLVDIMDINDIKKNVLERLNRSENGSCDSGAKEVEVDPASGETKAAESQCVNYSENDIKVFAVSATDGLLDYVPEQAIVEHVAKGLYNTAADTGNPKGGPHTKHPLTACENLIYTAANGWQEDKGGRYRDDIAIVYTALRGQLSALFYIVRAKKVH
jgi:serine/threonine protein phosphatase PrpC